jgi:hypothetical protein
MTLISCCRTGLCLALLPLTGGCGLIIDSCDVETRDVTASTSQTPGSVPDYAQVLLTQDRGRPGSFYWVIEGPLLPPGEVDPYPYEEHVLAARLLDGGANMALLMELPVRSYEGLAGVGGDLPVYTGPIAFDQLFAMVRAGQTVLDVTTDIPGQERMLRPLVTVVFRNWRRVPCE